VHPFKINVLKDVAEKIGTGSRAILDDEKGKLTKSIADYTDLLWAYDLLEPWNDLVSRSNDKDGHALVQVRDRARASYNNGLDDDF